LVENLESDYVLGLYRSDKRTHHSGRAGCTSHFQTKEHTRKGQSDSEKLQMGRAEVKISPRHQDHDQKQNR